MSMNKKMPYAEGWARLVKEGKEGKRPKEENPERLPINEIVMAHSVFQPRLFDGDAANSAAHVSLLAGCIRSKPGHLLDPIIVWWSGKYWRVIDGHHRHVAYVQTARDPKRPVVFGPVPVTVFKGSITQARNEAIRLNVKDKLPMTRTDKLDQAWRLVAHNKESGMSKSEIAALTTVADGTVANMRRTYAMLSAKTNDAHFHEATPMFTPEALLNMRWADARKWAIGEVTRDEEWAEKQAKEWAVRMAKTFGTKLATNPTIAARALELYSEPLPEKLTEVWRDIAQDVLDNEDEREKALMDGELGAVDVSNPEAEPGV